MTRDEQLRQLERLVEVKPGTLHGTEELADLPDWDSLTQVNFVLIVERATGVRPSVTKLAKCSTVQDLLDVFDGAQPVSR
ncbi:MAG: acyl carrier protein [Planctomycetes bacterium]|nr:acyl carrier protein [Planctomycetota bacterium]